MLRSIRQNESYVILSIVFLLFHGGLWAGKTINTPPQKIVGVSLQKSIIPDLSESVSIRGGNKWTHQITEVDATFIKTHFVGVNLRAGDRIILRSESGRVIEVITGRGPKNLGTFWSLSSFGQRVKIEFEFAQVYRELPFQIDQIIVGNADLFDPPTDTGRSVCSPGDFEDVVCYQGDAGKWANVQASVGVMSLGGDPNAALFCSGANVSPLNYVLTNAHCITSQASCDSSEFVFKFYRTGCNSGPVTEDWMSYRCDEVVATSPFISCDAGLGDLDFALNSVIGDPSALFGFVEPDPLPVTDGEDIYIVQHPDGRPHEITHGGGANVDVDGTVLRYYDTLDTEGGSSGSPIFREMDDLLVGLHHCGGCSTPGVGNRGMLMSDIYPLIETYLCSPGVDLSGSGYESLAEIAGNGDAVIDPGETWQFVPRLRNGSCDTMAISSSADLQVNAGSAMPVTLLDTGADFGNIAASSSAAANAPVRFVVDATAPCGGEIVIDMVNITAANGGPFGDSLSYFTAPIGEQVFTTLFAEDFAAGIGAAWTVVDGGTGSGPAETWTTDNPGGRSIPLTAPFAIVDSDELGTTFVMDEELISPLVDTSGVPQVSLHFNHDFNWYSGGADEQADVDVRSAATAGSWVNIANYSGGNSSGTQEFDLTSYAAADLQVRFHYYNAEFEWWWAIDDIFVLSAETVCNITQTAIHSADFENGNLDEWLIIVP